MRGMKLHGKIGLAFIAGAILSSGCNKPTPAPEPAKTAPENASKGTAAESPKPDPGPTPTTKPAVPQEKALEITKPGTGGWKPEKSTPETVGQRIDRSLHTVENATVQGQLIVENAKEFGTMATRLLVLDKERFRLDVMTPEAPTKVIIRLGNGGRRVTNKNNSMVTDSDVPRTGPGMVERWPSQFPDEIARAVASKKPVFGPLVTALRKDWNVRMERLMIPVNGKDVPFDRILATHKKNSKRVWEIRCEGNQALPVTIKISDVDAKGKPYKAQWNLNWSFKTKIDPAKFALPKVTN